MVNSLASEYGLNLVWKREFHEIFEDYQSDPEFGPLMVRMRVKNENGESSMTEDQWEAASEAFQFIFGTEADPMHRRVHRVRVREAWLSRILLKYTQEHVEDSLLYHAE